MYVLLDDDLGRLTLRRLRPWHRLLARCLAVRLDRNLADGVRPELGAILAARALRLTSSRFRRDLAASAADPGAPPGRLTWKEFRGDWLRTGHLGHNSAESSRLLTGCLKDVIEFACAGSTVAWPVGVTDAAAR